MEPTAAPQRPSAAHASHAGAPDALLAMLEPIAPSGFERPAAERFVELGEGFGAQTRIDAVNNAFAEVNLGAPVSVMLIGHLDEIGLIVTKIESSGVLRCDQIGGWDRAVVIGQRVRIRARAGEVDGCVVRAPIHMIEGSARSQLPLLHDLWIDIGARDGDAARELVRVGDPLVLAGDPTMLPGDRLLARALDNRVGTYVALEVARRLKGDERVHTIAMGSTREETIGTGALSGAFSYAPDVVIGLDVSETTDIPVGQHDCDVEMGAGPVVTRGSVTSTVLVDRALALAEQHGHAVQLRAAASHTWTDADNAAIAGEGLPTMLVEVPVRNLHTPCEIVDLADLEAAVSLLVDIIPHLRGE